MKQGLENLSLDGYNTVLDCIFGIGFRGDEIGDPYKTAIERINESGAYVVSADINSGLGANSGLAGEDDDGACVRSNLTVSLGSFKSGHFLNSAKDYIENKVNRDIGIESVGDAAYLIEPSDIRRIFCGRLQNSNKGDYGYVAIIGGSVEYSGAAKLANLALSALRSGAGVSKLAVPRCITKAVLPYILESTLYELDDIDGQFCFSHGAIDRLLYHTRAAAVGMGMGRSDEVKRLLEYMLCEYSGRLIIDADGLNVLAGMDIKYFKNASCRLILTPHPKEFERLCGKKFDECRHDLVTAAKEYAEHRHDSAAQGHDHNNNRRQYRVPVRQRRLRHGYRRKRRRAVRNPRRNLRICQRRRPLARSRGRRVSERTGRSSRVARDTVGSDDFGRHGAPHPRRHARDYRLT